MRFTLGKLTEFSKWLSRGQKQGGEEGKWEVRKSRGGGGEGRERRWKVEPLL